MTTPREELGVLAGSSRQPEQQQQQGNSNSDYGRQRDELDAAPSITVLGTVDKGVAVRLNWRRGIVTISMGRLKFLRDELGFVVRDDPGQYIL